MIVLEGGQEAYIQISLTGISSTAADRLTCFQVCDILVLRLVLIVLTAAWGRKEGAEKRGNAVVGKERLEAVRRTAVANVRGVMKCGW